MSRRCHACFHERRRAIDAELISGQHTTESLAKEFGIGVGALRRHKAVHLAKAIAKAGASKTEVQMTLDSEALATELLRLKQRAEDLGIQAERESDLRTALLAVREMRGLIELQTRVTLEMQSSAQNVSVHPAWVRLRSAILAALLPHPEAHASVCDAMRSVLGDPTPPGGMHRLMEGGGGA